MALQGKVGLLDKVQEGNSYTSVVSLYHINESTMHYVKKEEEMCAAVRASAPHVTLVTVVVGVAVRAAIHLHSSASTSYTGHYFHY